MADDDFMKLAKGRYPLSTNISSAYFWAPGDVTHTEIKDASGNDLKSYGSHIPRPDRHLETLQNLTWLGFLGLDHFYLRSPATGIAKLLTLGGFGLWWLFDIVQLWTEKERVLNYGLTAPFEWITGIGQGMIYSGDSKNYKYKQTTSFTTWMVATLFGFTGIDMFVLGRLWLGVRKFMIFMLAGSAVAPMVLIFLERGLWASLDSAGIFGMPYKIFCLMLFMAITMIWLGDMSTLMGHPDKIMREGMPVGETPYDALGWWRRLYLDGSGNPAPVEDEDEDAFKQEYENMQKNYMFERDGITGDELRRRFWIAYEGEKPAPINAKSAPGLPPWTMFMRICKIIYGWLKKAYEKIEETVLKNMGPQGQAILAAKKLQKFGMKMVEGKKSLSLDTLADAAGDVASVLPGNKGAQVRKGLKQARQVYGQVQQGIQQAEQFYDQAKQGYEQVKGVVGQVQQGVEQVKGVVGQVQQGFSGVTGSNPFSSVLGQVDATGSNPLSSVLGHVGATGSNPSLSSLFSPAGVTGSNPSLSSLFSPAGVTGSKPSLTSFLSHAGATGSSPLSSVFSARPGASLFGSAKGKFGSLGAFHKGGATPEDSKPLSLEAQVMGAAIVAIIAGGSLKGLIDYLMTE
jgi:TM2 domain-containing membrane protein YozV